MNISLQKYLPHAVADVHFLTDTICLFNGQNAGHMGKHQYADHVGVRDTQPMSGAKLWHHFSTRATEYYIPGGDCALLQNSLEDIARFVPSGLPLVDLGPGSTAAINNKSIPLLQKVRASHYQPIDISEKFVDDAKEFMSSQIPDIENIGKIADIFSLNGSHDYKSQILAYFGGGTINNFPGPAYNETMQARLSRTLNCIANFTGDGYLLASFDSNRNGAQLEVMYRNSIHCLFGVNVFHRMACELPMEHFDPSLFTYDPVWHAEHDLIAHTAIATAPQRFRLMGKEYKVMAGQSFHLNNSYKFSEEIFEETAEANGWLTISRWSHNTPMRLYLLKTV